MIYYFHKNDEMCIQRKLYNPIRPQLRFEEMLLMQIMEGQIGQKLTILNT